MQAFIPSFTLEGFYLGPFYVYTWGLLAAMGVLVAVKMAARKNENFRKNLFSKGKKEKSEEKFLSANQFWNFSFWLVISIFLGARLLFILENWEYYFSKFFEIFQLWKGGFSFFGGIFGGIIFSYFWSKKNEIEFSFLTWLFTPAWLFGLFFGRIGFFLIHDHVGRPTNLPWGVWVQGTYRHEPALEELVWIGLIGFILQRLDKWDEEKKEKKIFRKILFPLSLALYSCGRFWLDFWRAAPGEGGDDSRFYGLTPAQWISILIFVWGVVKIKKIRNKK